MVEIDLWLDDIRPAPEGWVHVKTADEAKALLKQGSVRRASFDHDLGVCSDCYKGSPEQWLEEHGYQSMPHCEHFGTGYTLICWMEENDCWPTERPTVHSANPVGRAKMNAAISRKFDPNG